mgnify:CR=1 FL=1
MSSALIRLRERSAQFSSTERGVAERILAEPQLVVDLSVHELAQKTFSSPFPFFYLFPFLKFSHAAPSAPFLSSIS